MTDGTTYYIQVISNITDGKVFAGADAGSSYANGDEIDKDGNPIGGKDLAFEVSEVTVPNTAPVITSDSGAATASINVAENTTAVTTVTATDVDGDILTFSITGGIDAALFSITAAMLFG